MKMMSIALLVACLSTQVTVDAEREVPENLKWSDFPSDFVFGVSTAAAQIEGSTNTEGKGPSVWDHLVEKSPDKILDGSNLSIAIDSYKRYKKDVIYVKRLGVHSYRFSIAWSRILPKGTLSGGVNQQGVKHYNKLIDQLIKNGITPYVTLLHFDAPQALYDSYGGILNRSFVNDYKDYSELCFKTYGDRVKNWITINEPLIMVQDYAGNEPYNATHNLLLSHATVVQLYRERFQAKQGGQIGWSLVGQYIEPYSDLPKDIAAARRLLDFGLGWFVEPLVHGDYPKSMRKLLKERLPWFTREEKMLVKGAFDFIGINYYTTRYGRDASSTIGNSTDSSAFANITDVHGAPIGPQSNGSRFIYSYPIGLKKLLTFMKNEYSNPKMYITENGITEQNDPAYGNTRQARHDPHRIECIQNHLHMIKMAMKRGVIVKGYFHYTVFDDFEWIEGFIPRYGLYYVDRSDDLKRIPKESAKWLRKFLKT